MLESVRLEKCQTLEFYAALVALIVMIEKPLAGFSLRVVKNPSNVLFSSFILAPLYLCWMNQILLGEFKMKLRYSVILGLACAAFAGSVFAQDETPEMGFFVTSVGVGNGADLGGLEGADAHCQALAEEAGSTRTWAAYLSAKPEGNMGAVHARDRIGEGPWYNVSGVLIAPDLDRLHYDNSNLTYLTARDEMGNTPNRHDILTGSYMDGTLVDAEDGTCSNWTSSSDGNAGVGHSDRHAGVTPGSSWNYHHLSRGCSQENLQASGGDGLFYCFATD